MTDKRLVDIGDGRIVEMTEMGEGPQDLTPVSKPRQKKPGSKATAPRKKSKKHAGFKDHKRKKYKRGGNAFANKMLIPGYREWLIMRRRIVERLFMPNKKSRFGVPDGMRREEADKLWEIAREKARKNMADLKKAGVIDGNDERAEKAMLATLEVMHAPGNQAIKLTAARQVLEWTKAKPAAKQEFTVNAAEAWLATLSEDKDD